ncbi:hypothetical protein C8Q76DRAFT_689514 [Earliella scabrosa]|nr:hypothetical protein C8Q76DRAFT_689514 [Earliella scabrosa]
MAPRRELTDLAKCRRRTLYKDGQRPSKEAKDAMYEEIKKMQGCGWYTKHNHSNWCTEEERKITVKLRDYVASKLQQDSNPRLSDIEQWAHQFHSNVRDAMLAVADERLEAQTVAGPPADLQTIASPFALPQTFAGPSHQATLYNPFPQHVASRFNHASSFNPDAPASFDSYMGFDSTPYMQF